MALLSPGAPEILIHNARRGYYTFQYSGAASSVTVEVRGNSAQDWETVGTLSAGASQGMQITAGSQVRATAAGGTADFSYNR